MSINAINTANAKCLIVHAKFPSKCGLRYVSSNQFMKKWADASKSNGSTFGGQTEVKKKDNFSNIHSILQNSSRKENGDSNKKANNPPEQLRFLKGLLDRAASKESERLQSDNPRQPLTRLRSNNNRTRSFEDNIQKPRNSLETERNGKPMRPPTSSNNGGSFENLQSSLISRQSQNNSIRRPSNQMFNRQDQNVIPPIREATKRAKKDNSNLPDYMRTGIEYSGPTLATIKQVESLDGLNMAKFIDKDGTISKEPTYLGDALKRLDHDKFDLIYVGLDNSSKIPLVKEQLRIKKSTEKRTTSSHSIVKGARISWSISSSDLDKQKKKELLRHFSKGYRVVIVLDDARLLGKASLERDVSRAIEKTDTNKVPVEFKERDLQDELTMIRREKIVSELLEILEESGAKEYGARIGNVATRLILRFQGEEVTESGDDKRALKEEKKREKLEKAKRQQERHAKKLAEKNV